MKDEQDTDSDVGRGFSSSGGDGKERTDAVGLGCENKTSL